MIRAAVKSATDSEDRSRNIIVYGIEETDNEVLPDTVSDILQEIGEKPVVTIVGSYVIFSGKVRQVRLICFVRLSAVKCLNITRNATTFPKSYVT
jgi:hypothetical protein